jgi:hypothetical protein
MDSREPVPVYTVSNAPAAEIIKNFLAGEGIRAFIENEDQAALQGVGGIAIRILVSAADAERARNLIHEHEPHKRSPESQEEFDQEEFEQDPE